VAVEPGTQGPLAPGSEVAGYVIEQRVGSGGMAVVYRARDDTLGRLVAIKVLSPELAMDTEFRTRFLRESRAVAAVEEPHIVPVYGAGEANGVLYIATRFVADGDLGRLQRAVGGPLPSAQVADIISQVASALDAAHAAGLVHRDVKPGNILVEFPPGRLEQVYLSDFGLSKSTTAVSTGLSVAGRFMGTPDYCAPEQVIGARVDGRTDQYSLACVAFSLLAGVVPFGGGDSLSRLYAHVNSPVPALTAIRPELGTAVDMVVARGMAKDPAARYESCAAFAWALRAALASAEQAARPNMMDAGQAGPWVPGPPPVIGPPVTGRPPRRNTGLIIAGSAAAVVVVAGAIAGVALATHGGNGPSGLHTGPPATSSSGTGGTGGTGGTTSAPAEIIHTGTATLLATMTVPGGKPMTDAFFSADGNYIVAAGTSSDFYVFSAQTLKLVNTVSIPAKDSGFPLSFSADDQTVYVVDFTQNQVYDFDIATGKASHVYSLPSGQDVYTTNGSSVADAISSNGTVTEYAAATGKEYAQVPNPGKAAVSDVRSDADGGYLIINDKNGASYLVDALSKQVVETFSYNPSASENLWPDVSPDGSTVYVPGGAAGAKLWDRTTGSYITPSDSRWPTPDSGVTFGSDSKFVLTSPASASEVVDVWNVATRAHVITVTVPGSSNEDILAVGPGASELLSTGSLNISQQTFSKLEIWSIPG